MPSPIVCGKCQIEKGYDEYRQREKGVSYDICIQCWREELALFWATKQYRVCKTCNETLPLRKYRKDQYCIPYMVCLECYNKKAQEKYQQLRASRVIPLELVEPKPLSKLDIMHLQMLGDIN